jgi:predicted RNase H-like HicB family nuclease
MALSWPSTSWGVEEWYDDRQCLMIGAGEALDNGARLLQSKPNLLLAAEGGGCVRYSVFLEPVDEPGFEGYYYAHIPTLDLTTHGVGVEGALKAIQELAEAWIAEKRTHGDPVPVERHAMMAHIDVPDAVLRP